MPKNLRNCSRRRSLGAAPMVALLTLAGAVSSCKSPPPDTSAKPTSLASAESPGEATFLPIGASLPNVSAVAHTGEQVRFRELEGKPVVVYFYPKDDTPGCTVEAQEIRDLWQEIQATGAKVVGVSVDDLASHKAFADKHALPFSLLADTEHEVVRAFGVPLKNGKASRVSFVFNRNGKLVKVFRDVKAEGHARELVETLRTLEG